MTGRFIQKYMDALEVKIESTATRCVLAGLLRYNGPTSVFTPNEMICVTRRPLVKRICWEKLSKKRLFIKRNI